MASINYKGLIMVEFVIWITAVGCLVKIEQKWGIVSYLEKLKKKEVEKGLCNG